MTMQVQISNLKSNNCSDNISKLTISEQKHINGGNNAFDERLWKDYSNYKNDISPDNNPTGIGFTYTKKDGTKVQLIGGDRPGFRIL
jgi:hypothetical protein